MRHSSLSDAGYGNGTRGLLAHTQRRSLITLSSSQAHNTEGAKESNGGIRGFGNVAITNKSINSTEGGESNRGGGGDVGPKKVAEGEANPTLPAPRVSFRKRDTRRLSSIDLKQILALRGAEERRRSSHSRSSSILLQAEQQQIIKEAEMKVLQVTNELKILESQHALLKDELKDLKAIHQSCLQTAIKTAWQFCPDNCKNLFEYLPQMNPSLIETGTRVGDYVIDRVLGKGQFSSVHMCFKRPMMNNSSPPSSPKHAKAAAANASSQHPQAQIESHCTKLAIKIINKESIYSIESVVAVENELKALAILQTHPNIINVFDCIHGPTNLYIVTEQLGTDLFEFMEVYQFRINFIVVGVIMRYLMRAVSHLASNHVVHRDIKPENVLITVTRDDIIVKLTDFGMCKFLSPHDSTLKEFCGSQGFFAPEVLLRSSFCALAAEIWSLGVVSLELLTSQSFFSNEWISAYDSLNSPTPQDFSQKIRDAIDATEREIRRRKYSDPSIRDCVMSMLSIDASLRPKICTILQNAWIANCNPGVAADSLNGTCPVSQCLNVMHAMPYDHMTYLTPHYPILYYYF